MADVITRFRLETTQYDSKLRDAAKGLKEVVRVAELGGKDFKDFSQKSIEAARSLGQTASGATNAKDRLKDLVGSFNEAAKAYNRLSQAQQQSDFGKALSQSLEQLQQRIKQTKDELYNLGDAVNGKSGGLFGGDKFSGMLQVFGGNVMTKVAGVGIGLVGELKDAVSQGIELARAGEGVRIAFERLGRGDILKGLREATHGTVTDLELMKAAVKFNDFKLPLEELGTMLAFAQQKAKDTGQSVDYMVDSIVTGLGRKSLMILDNLGLSAAEIKDKMKETGDMTKAVGEIIREQMAKAGDYVETAADRATQANVSLQNKMEELGRKFAPVEEASNQLWTSMKIAIMDVVSGPLAKMLNQLTEAGRLKNMLDKMNGNSDEGNTKVDNQLKKLQAIKSAGGSDYIFNATLSSMLEDYYRQINDLDKKIKNGGKWEGEKKGFYHYESVDVLQRQKDALTIMLNQLQAGAKDITAPTPTTTTPVPVVIEPGGGNEPDWSKILAFNPSEIEKAGIADNFQSLFGNEEFMTIQRKLMGMDGETTRDWGKEIGKVFAEYVSDPDKEKRDGEKDGEKTSQEQLQGIQTMVGSLQSITNGIETLGIELPKELTDIIGVLQTITGIVGSIQAMQEVGTWLGLFNNGGIVSHAAGGTVAGSHFSGDVTPILANAGEVVLNRAQVNHLATDITSRDNGSGGNGRPYVDGETIYLGLSAYLKSTGRGEIMTSRFK